MNEFVLLRPYWLLALLPAGFLLWKLWRKNSQQTGWKSVIDQAFVPYLLASEKAKSTRPLGLIGLGMLWFLAIMALSGPSWHTEPIPTQKTQTGTVIVLDLSLSMFADDISPNRLTRVQFKINDLLETYPEVRVGMVGYSGSAHIISPIADDNRTLKNLLPHLNPLIMPDYGADAVAAFELAINLIQGAQVNQGHIIWITDDIENNEINRLAELIKLNNLSLSLLAVGTEIGGAINIPQYGLLKTPQDELVQAAVPLSRLAELANKTEANFQRLQLNNSDLAGLVADYLAEKTQQQDEKILSQALDYGVYLLAIILFIAAFSLRRGWLANVAALFLLPGLVISPPGYAQATENGDAKKPQIELSDRWRQLYMTGDQRGYQAWQQQDYIAAEREFENPNWRAAALYRQGQYQQAAELYQQDPSAQGQFNLGNALAHLGELTAAKQAYQKALGLKPDFEAAQKNLALVEQQLKNQPNQQDSQKNNEQESNSDSGQKQQNQPQNQGEQANQDSDSLSNEEQADPSSDDAAEQQDSQASANQSGDAQAQDEMDAMSAKQNQSESDDSQTEQNLLSNNMVEQSENDQTASQLQREQQQANQAWLNQIQDRPGLFLQRKFDYQYQQNPPANPQKNKSKLW